MGESYFWKPFAQGVATPIVLIGGTNLLLKDFKVSNPYLYWGGLAASSALVVGILADKVKVPILNAESFKKRKIDAETRKKIGKAVADEVAEAFPDIMWAGLKNGLPMTEKGFVDNVRIGCDESWPLESDFRQMRYVLERNGYYDGFNRWDDNEPYTDEYLKKTCWAECKRQIVAKAKEEAPKIVAQAKEEYGAETISKDMTFNIDIEDAEIDNEDELREQGYTEEEIGELADNITSSFDKDYILDDLKDNQLDGLFGDIYLAQYSAYLKSRDAMVDDIDASIDYNVGAGGWNAETFESDYDDEKIRDWLKTNYMTFNELLENHYTYEGLMAWLSENHDEVYEEWMNSNQRGIAHRTPYQKIYDAETFNSDSHTDSFMADMPVNAVRNEHGDGWSIDSVHRKDYKETFKNWKPSKYPYEKRITQDSVNEGCNSCGKENVHYQFYLPRTNSVNPKMRFVDGATYCHYDTNNCGGNICGDCAEDASCENCGAEICSYCEQENNYDHSDLVCVDCREFNESLEDD